MVCKADPTKEDTGGASGTLDEAGRERRPREGRLKKRDKRRQDKRREEKRRKQKALQSYVALQGFGYSWLVGWTNRTV
jgi:hypothetical protein